jgi:hypothetical protein
MNEMINEKDFFGTPPIIESEIRGTVNSVDEIPPTENWLISRWLWWSMKMWLPFISRKTRDWDRINYDLKRTSTGRYSAQLIVIRGKSVIRRFMIDMTTARGTCNAVIAVLASCRQD